MPSWSKDPRDRQPAGRGILRKHTRGDVWYFHHKGEDGCWKAVSTGHRDKAGAIDWALGHSLELTRIEKGIFKPDEKVSNDQIVAAYDEWLGYVKTQRKSKTFKAYTSVKNNLEAYLATRPRVKRLSQLDLQEALALRKWLLDGGRSKATCDNNFIVIRAFLNWCVTMKKVRSNPVREQAQGGVEVFFNDSRPRIETYTTAEYAAIITQADPELARLCRFLGHTGMRISEAAMLEWSDVDLAGGWLHVRVKRTHDGFDYSPKDSTDRKIPLHPKLVPILRELRGRGGQPGYVFPGLDGPTRSDHFARIWLKRLKALSKVTDVPADTLTLHNFRRYFVSQCADCGIDMACVMAWLGHDDLEMVLHYYRLRDAHAQAAIQRYTTGVVGGATTDAAEPSSQPSEQIDPERAPAETTV